ncbi:acetyltransferase [Naegleria gruberi]|uniref:Glucosamine 6-phosphate N-acetyltransferase n=1 Tax=Naegleria gruberi TaxID=5762 RepID=D2UXQ2_NAEGR|nr:acetyltransferase [Naegleria gruberi]EFC50326.1 acetyltransferase [Naegleria gruberi]|eukprot:XP_002683070.1 acetyltransferase [Naegleria gruberi strain NEG-M]
MKREETTIERRLTQLKTHLIGFDNDHVEINSTSNTDPNSIVFNARPIENDDFDKGYLQLLSQLTSVGDISKEAFTHRLSKMDNDVYRIVVIEDPTSKKIVAAATVFVELKFVHNCGKVGHIEDVVVDSSVRGQYLGVKVIEACKQFAKEKGCYKTILDCSERNVSFYERCGFKKKELQMRFDHE